jgi:hypothetical protein
MLLYCAYSIFIPFTAFPAYSALISRERGRTSFASVRCRKGVDSGDLRQSRNGRNEKQAE